MCPGASGVSGALMVSLAPTRPRNRYRDGKPVNHEHSSSLDRLRRRRAPEADKRQRRGMCCKRRPPGGRAEAIRGVPAAGVPARLLRSVDFIGVRSTVRGPARSCSAQACSDVAVGSVFHIDDADAALAVAVHGHEGGAVERAFVTPRERAALVPADGRVRAALRRFRPVLLSTPSVYLSTRASCASKARAPRLIGRLRHRDWLASRERLADRAYRDCARRRTDARATTNAGRAPRS